MLGQSANFRGLGKKVVVGVCERGEGLIPHAHYVNTYL